MKSAFVTIIGRPSAGKSTLLNKFCSQKVSIVSSVPQTTRNAVRGIVNRAEGQLVFTDTPGRHSSEKKMNKKLMEVSARSLAECDLVLYVIDCARGAGQEEEEIASLLRPFSQKITAAVNKTDAAGADFEKSKEFILTRLPEIKENNIIAVSALTGAGAEDVLSSLFNMAAEGHAFYDGDYYTDQETGFRITEIIREQAINRLRQELPHSIYVEIADMEFKEEKLWVRAFIIVERESQKGMVVGKGGEMIKAIRLGALKNLKNIFEWKIDLDLRVKTSKDWRSNDNTLRKIIDR